MRLKIITIVLLLITSNLFGKSNDNIKIFTEQLPPYNMMVDGKLTGISAEMLGAMLKQMKSKQSLKDIKLVNWARGYSLTQKIKNTMIFSTARTKEREKLFKWVGPVTQATIGIIAPKRKNIKINKISDLNKYKIGAVLKDIGEILLLSNGVNKNIIQYVKGKDVVSVSFKKMKKNRIDMFSYATEVAFRTGKAKGFDIDKYEVVYVLQKTDLYFAFNKSTDDSIINKWQKALDKVKNNYLHSKIIEKY